MNLEGKTIVITGASAGLGVDFSGALIKKGAAVFGLARRLDKLHTVKDELGDAFIPVECDVANEHQVKDAFNRVAEEREGVDVLINNAGLGRFGHVEELTAEDWDIQMNVNLRGVFLCTREVVPLMKKQNAENGFGGHIINIGSVAGLVANPEVSAYNTTKFGLRGFSEALMKELRYEGIKVTCFYPGSIHTDFFQAAGTTLAANAMTVEDITSSVIHVLETSDNYLISEIAMRPLKP